MTVAMTVILTTHASNLTEALTVVVLGGLLQMLLGLAKIGRYVVYTPYVVVSGFMSGIGVIVILIQVLPFLGAPRARTSCCRRSSRLSFSRSWGRSTVSSLPWWRIR